MSDWFPGAALRLGLTETILERMHHVPSLTGDRLVAIMLEKDCGKLLLLDARAPEEFRESHIEGAVRIDPETTATEFRKRFPAGLEEKTVVAYCSVGERSAVLLERLLDLIMEMGAKDAYNLKGGIFRWHADGREVVDEKGPTDRMHPCNALWGMLVVPRGDQTADPSGTASGQ